MAHSFFSIIVTSLNPGEGMDLTLRSVLEQDFKDYEVLIKDGGSTDHSIERIPEDERIHLITQKDKSIYDGMNQALPHINGRYVMFLNCGDKFHDAYVLRQVADFIEQDGGTAWEKTEKSAEEADSNTPRIYYGDQYNVLQNAVVSSAPVINDFACYRNVPCHQVCFYGAELFQERGYDPMFRVRADYEHFLYSRYERGAVCIHMPIMIADYEGGGYSETRENRIRSAEEHKIITNRYLGAVKCRKYHCIMLLTLQPLRTALAEDPRFSGIYNSAKSMVYRMLGRKGHR